MENAMCCWGMWLAEQRASKDVHVLILELYEFGKKDLADMIKIKDCEMGRLTWIIQVNQIQSHES